MARDLDRVWWTLAAMLSCVGLLGCSSFFDRFGSRQMEFDRLDRAGRVAVGVQSVSPFENYVDSLQPRFKLTPESAYQEAIAQTQISELEELRALLVEIAVNLPRASHAVSSTQERHEGVPGQDDVSSSTRSESRQESSPEVPSPDLPAALERALAKLEPGSRSFSMDPALRYRAAAALLQEVALLSSYVKDAAISRNTIPFVVRQLITVFPSARREPYDVYTTIAFFSGKAVSVEKAFAPTLLKARLRGEKVDDLAALGDLSRSVRGVKVIPLFVTDNLETTWVATSRTAVRDVGVSASGGGVSAGAGAGARSQRENGERNLSRDLNSLFTVGRVAENAVEVRLGAASVDGTYQIVPRTFNLTSLILVPRVDYEDVARVRGAFGLGPSSGAVKDVDLLQREIEVERRASEVLPYEAVKYTAHTEMRNVRSGAVLPSPRFEDLAASLAQDLRTLLPQSQLAKIPSAETLVENALTGDYESFLEGTGNDGGAAYAPMIWARLARLLASAGYASGTFPIYLPEVTFFESDPRLWNQVTNAWTSLAPPALLDDGKVALLRLSGGEGLAARGFTAHLDFEAKGGGRRVAVAATSIKTDEEGRTAAFEFPSILSLMEASKNVTVGISYRPSLYRWTRVAGSPDTVFDWYRGDLSVLDVKKKEKDGDAGVPKPSFRVELSSQTVRSVDRGNGQLAVSFLRDKGDKVPVFGEVIFTLRGAHVVVAAPSLGSSDGAHVARVDTRYLLTLGGLVPGATVLLEAWRMEAPARDAKAGTESAKVSLPGLSIAIVGPESQRD